jgi:glucose-1-phosphate thymidylyltransferase
MEWIGLIPAAGKGVRLNLPYPKELYPIIRNNRYKPVSQFIVEQMTGAGVTHIVFVINETKHQLIGYFGDGTRFGCRFSYTVQEQVDNQSKSSSPGLADALDSAYHLIQGKIVFFGMPDTIIQPGDVFLQGLPLLDNYEVVLLLFPTQTPQKFGMVRCTSKKTVIEINDKPETTDLKNMWGCIIWKPTFTEWLHWQIHHENENDFAHIMNHAIAADISFGGVLIHRGNFIDLGTYDEIMELDKKLRDGEGS